MTKALICLVCVDVIAPHPDGTRWRLCQCGQSAIRWQDPDAGHVYVTSTGGPRLVRVLGLNNMYLQDAVALGRDQATADQWRHLHDRHTAEVPHNYLFHADRRACWAVVIAAGDTSDVTFVGPGDAPTPEETATP